MNKSIMQGMIKASIMKEALASCQMEGIGLDLTLEDLYLAELGYYKSEKKKQEVLIFNDPLKSKLKEENKQSVVEDRN